MDRFEKAFIWFASHSRVSVLTCIVAAMVGRLLLLWIFPAPVPGVHDEYSYLLSGATFALGRLTNQASPAWPSFETFHELQHPTYISMYPVAPGLFLALGYIVGSPWIGVLLSVALFCGAVTWALQKWLPPHWALAGGLLAVIKFSLVSYWIDSYWGGAVPALGGAIVVGSVPRLASKPTAKYAAIFSLGALVLANSRPYEGLWVVLCSAAWVVLQLGKQRSVFRRETLKVAVAGGTVLLAGFAAMSLFFHRSTGNMLEMPYMLYNRQYAITPAFFWQAIRAEPIFHHEVMRQYFERQSTLYWRIHSVRGWAHELYGRLSAFAMFYIWPGVLLICFTLPRLLRTQEARFALAVIAFVVAGISLENWPMMLHYPSPATAAVVLLIVCAIRASRGFRLFGRSVGRAVAWTVPTVCVAFLLARIAAAATDTPVPEHGLVSFFTVTHGNLLRAQLASQLNATPGRHLVLVRYRQSHDVSEEWVYNDPDLESAHVIWARETNAPDLQFLLRSFPGRTVWLMQPDEQPPKLTLYPRGLLTSSSLTLTLR
jgi:hypothetical protein